MKHCPTVVRCEIVGQAACKFLSLESRASLVGEFVEVLGDAGASRVRNGVYAKFCAIDEVVEGLEEVAG
jgi:hypothetical protein